MLSLALDPGRSGFRPTVIRVRITKSAIARNDQRDALFQRPHAAIVPDVLPDVFYRAPGTLVGSARADVEQNGRCDRHYDEYELHGSSPIGQLALNVRPEAVPRAKNIGKIPRHGFRPTRESIAAAARRLGIASPQAVEAVARGMARAREADRAGDLDACLRSLVDVQIAMLRFNASPSRRA
jgi:hypothetical protein